MGIINNNNLSRHAKNWKINLASMAHNYKGVAVITGSAQGIGRAIALRLADDGFDIALNDLPFQQTGLDEISTEITKKGRKSFVFTSDASVEAEVKALIDAVVSNLGGIDVVRTCSIRPLKTEHVLYCRWSPMREFVLSNHSSKVNR